MVLVKIKALLNVIIKCAEKASVIARAVRRERETFQLLIEEKTDDSAKNDRFLRDFKTLVDVLVQEMVRHEIAMQFPILAKSVYGEEDNLFTNAQGESIVVEIKSTAGETSDLLCKVLDSNRVVSELLAEIIHKPIQLEPDEQLSQIHNTIAIDDLGVWIDPIDGTNEYIKGDNVAPFDGIYTTGLQCVTVLIGIFHRKCGIPIAGVVNQPFYRTRTNGDWYGRCVWAVCYDGINYNSLKLKNRCSADAVNKCNVILSTSESNDLISRLNQSNVNLHYASGAGYKLLCVIDGKVDAYILSKGSTYKWDTCAAHAILLSMNGAIVNYEKLIARKFIPDDSHLLSLLYNEKDASSNKWNNKGGIIAYNSILTLEHLHSILVINTSGV